MFLSSFPATRSGTLNRSSNRAPPHTHAHIRLQSTHTGAHQHTNLSSTHTILTHTQGSDPHIPLLTLWGSCSDFLCLLTILISLPTPVHQPCSCVSYRRKTEEESEHQEQQETQIMTVKPQNRCDGQMVGGGGEEQDRVSGRGWCKERERKRQEDDRKGANASTSTSRLGGNVEEKAHDFMGEIEKKLACGTGPRRGVGEDENREDAVGIRIKTSHTLCRKSSKRCTVPPMKSCF
ncbi:hypothetical protein RRG08_031201 [Elysia crispata]|uniref:Uncharacterized protein n=1 Tax=Elysia crispata TaxID=231223 RepID=A0AAE1CJ50_9GAST|nr:hypothetical protein RRG08_031201 [Elysia crispata]